MAKELKNSATMIELEIPERGGPFVVVSKKYLAELKSALAAIVSGERALREGKTRSFREFIAKEFPAHAKNR
jgi:hypothetical protein